MTGMPHELDNDFPEHAARIHQLKDGSARFRKLFDAYNEINRAVHRAETDIEPTDDVHLEDLRKQRVRLKDEIYGMLTA
ncbi:MAG: YdcH family protein [Rhizobiaceae bacterium]